MTGVPPYRATCCAFALGAAACGVPSSAEAVDPGGDQGAPNVTDAASEVGRDPALKQEAALANDEPVSDASRTDVDGIDVSVDDAASALHLAWGDEFEGPAGASVDRSQWAFELGGGGWGNGELEAYTDRPANAALDGAGHLRITAMREAFAGASYTSARLTTRRIASWRYGRFEGRMQLPYGQGLWPALWLLGDDLATAGWPACGEIDIMENVGREPAIVHGTIHGPGYSAAAGPTASSQLASGRFADAFHVFAIEWEPAIIRWYLDDRLYATKTVADVPAGSAWVFAHPFFLILNLAVGGAWPGPPDATTAFPQTLLVDYVRVYQR